MAESNDSEKTTAVSISQRVTDTLYALTQNAGPISVRTIADGTGNSRSSAHRILQTLAESGFAEQRPDGSYSTGPRLVAFVDDPKSGRLTVMYGEDEVTIQDADLVRRLTRAAGK